MNSSQSNEHICDFTIYGCLDLWASPAFMFSVLIIVNKYHWPSLHTWNECQGALIMPRRRQNVNCASQRSEKDSCVVKKSSPHWRNPSDSWGCPSPASPSLISVMKSARLLSIKYCDTNTVICRNPAALKLVGMCWIKTLWPFSTSLNQKWKSINKCLDSMLLEDISSTASSQRNEQQEEHDANPKRTTSTFWKNVFQIYSPSPMKIRFGILQNTSTLMRNFPERSLFPYFIYEYRLNTMQMLMHFF